MLWLSAGLLCCSAIGAESVPLPRAEGDALGLAGFLALGFGLVLLTIVLYLAWFALFIHLATRLVGFGYPFSKAFDALIINFLLQLITTLVVAVFAPNSHLAYFLAYWGSATGAIMISYRGSFMRSLLAAVLAVVLTIAGTIGAIMLLVALFPVLLPAR